MCALTSPFHWIPEDDLLLKNAAEAGASLESLAKGAVRFSRQYTIQELQNRWHSLLYDPDTSEQASVHMIELELSASKGSSKFNKLTDLKGTTVPGKRKDEGVHSHYYAMRKRIRSEPFSNFDLSFLVGANPHHCNEHLNIENEHPGENCIIGEPVVDQFDLHDTNFDRVHPVFPQVIRDDSVVAGMNEAASHAFHSEHQEFEDCTAAFHLLEYSSPLSTTPIWRTMEDISAPSILTNENLGDKDKGTGVIMGCPIADSKKVNSPGYDVAQSDPHLDDIICDDGLKSSGETLDREFFELSNSLMNFTNEEGLQFMDDDGKNMMDRSCLDGLSSMLLSSPNDVHQDDTLNNTELKSSLSMDPCLVVPTVACAVELDVISNELQSDYKTYDSNSGEPSSTSAPNPGFPERRNGVICCTLNTEDPDIPCNDIFLHDLAHPPLVTSGLQHNSEKDGNSISLSTMELSVTRMPIEHGSNHAKEEESLKSSQVTEPQFETETSSNNQVSCDILSELSEKVSLDLTSMHTSIVRGEQHQCGLAHLSPFPISARETNEDNVKVELEKYCKFGSSVNLLLGTDQGFDNIEKHLLNTVDDYKQEPDAPGATPNNVSAEDGQFEVPFSDSVVNPSISDQEAHFCEDESDVPHFSDIEAMILDMDLVPCDQGSYTEVSRYQNEEAKRAIIRLELGVNSYMQRAMAFHRAFAVLYGRHLKHYIRKPKVVLGRATNDNIVDIDLAKEGRANRISRRQAIIKMEEDGSFFLKHLGGKGSIFVNGNEVASGHCIKLATGCLIEIISMSFIFETNQKAVGGHS